MRLISFSQVTRYKIMTDVKFVDNSDKFIKALNEQMKSAAEEIGQKVASAAKANCPVDTGNLRDSINYSVTDDGVTVGTDVEYGKYVELGSVHNHRASHFLLNAMQNNESSYKNIIESELKK